MTAREAWKTALTTWETAHDTLCDLYRLASRESEQGYDRESTRVAIAEAEKQEHEAWLAYLATEIVK